MLKTNYAAWEIEPLAVLPESRVSFYRHLIGWAVLAPNTHNVQPWRFRLRCEEQKIEVLLHPSGILPVSDRLGRQAHISIGCAIANILAAATAYGFTPSWSFHGGSFPKALARVSVGEPTQVPLSNDKVLVAMKNRRVNRSEFDPRKPVPDSFIQRLHALANLHAIEIDLVRDFPTLAAVAEVQGLADNSVLIMDDFRIELAAFFLPNDTQEFVGMPGNTFGLTDARSRQIHETLKSGGIFPPDWAAGFASAGRAGIRSAPLLVVLSVARDDPGQWLRAGVAFQEMALEAEMTGLAVAVHAALVEVGIFNTLLRGRLRRKERPTVVFRIGYGTESRPHSPRLPATAVIVDNS